MQPLFFSFFEMDEKEEAIVITLFFSTLLRGYWIV